jgi:hypothetical protein
MAKNRIQAATVLTISTASLGSLTLVGNLTANAGFLRFTNTCSAVIAVSYDGTNTHDLVLPNSQCEVPAQLVSSPNNNVAQFPIGMPIYAIAVGGEEAGSFSVSCYYQSN